MLSYNTGLKLVTHQLPLSELTRENKLRKQHNEWRRFMPKLVHLLCTMYEIIRGCIQSGRLFCAINLGTRCNNSRSKGTANAPGRSTAIIRDFVGEQTSTSCPQIQKFLRRCSSINLVCLQTGKDCYNLRLWSCWLTSYHSWEGQATETLIFRHYVTIPYLRRYKVTAYPTMYGTQYSLHS